jgi:hypothetical protein
MVTLAKMKCVQNLIYFPSKLQFLLKLIVLEN